MSRLTLLGLLALVVVVMWGLTFVSERFERVSSNVAPLETAVFETPSLVALGTGGTFENPARIGPALAVGAGESVVLIDAGRGVAEALRQAEIPTSQPRHVLLTSLLPENTVGLDDLLATGWLAPRDGAVHVYGPEGTAALAAGLPGAHETGLAAQGAAWGLPPGGARLDATELVGGEQFEIAGWSVRVAALGGAGHPELAYRLEQGAHGIVVAAAGSDPDAVAALSQGVATLAVGALYGASLDTALEAGAERPEVLRREAARHFRLEDLGALAGRAGVRQVVLTRLRPPPVFDFQYERIVGSGFRGQVEVAADGDVVPLVTP